MKPLSDLLDEKIERDADKYVKLKHIKEQWHFENPEKRGPLPGKLQQENYMFKAGANSLKGMILELVEALEEIKFDGTFVDGINEVDFTEEANTAIEALQKLRKELGG